jgi:hypothetical protein
MDNRNDKEKWVNEVMGSLEGMERAEGNPFLYGKVMSRLEKREVADVASSGSFLPKWALAGVLVLVLNGMAIVKEIHRGNIARHTDVNSVPMELDTQTTYNY